MKKKLLTCSRSCFQDVVTFSRQSWLDQQPLPPYCRESACTLCSKGDKRSKAISRVDGRLKALLRGGSFEPSHRYCFNLPTIYDSVRVGQNSLASGLASSPRKIRWASLGLQNSTDSRRSGLPWLFICNRKWANSDEPTLSVRI